MKRENTTLSRKQNYKYFKNTYTYSFLLVFSNVIIIAIVLLRIPFEAMS